MPRLDGFEDGAMRVVSATHSDTTGRLFESPDGRLFRGINRLAEPFIQNLIDSGLIDSLCRKGRLVETWVSDRRIEGFDLVLEHRRIPYVTYSNEWTPEMLRDAALQVLSLQTELIEAGVQLQDGHCMNLLFDATRPVWVDFGSLQASTPTALWPAADEFCRWCLHPLAMSAAGLTSEARVLASDYLSGIPTRLIEKLCPDYTSKWTHASFIGMEVNQQNRLALVDTLAREVSELSLSRCTTEWSEYYTGTPAGIEPSDGWRPKQWVFYEILKRLRPSSLVDIGSNRSVYGQIAARIGITVAAFDRDETSVADLYSDAKNRNLPVTPLLCDLMNPTPARGINCRWFPSVHERLQSEMAVALALVHHLVFKQRLDFDQIVKCFASFTRKWLLVEFIPRNDKYVKEWLEPKHDWYTLDNFLGSLKKHFRRAELIPSDPEPRLFVLCEK